MNTFHSIRIILGGLAMLLLTGCSDEETPPCEEQSVEECSGACSTVGGALIDREKRCSLGYVDLGCSGQEIVSGIIVCWENRESGDIVFGHSTTGYPEEWVACSDETYGEFWGVPSCESSGVE